MAYHFFTRDEEGSYLLTAYFAVIFLFKWRALPEDIWSNGTNQVSFVCLSLYDLIIFML